MDLFLFYVWCASIAGDVKEYIAVAKSKDDALSQIPCWYRQDWDIRYATMDEVLDIGNGVYDGGDVVVFDGSFFEYNSKFGRFEYDCDVNYMVRPELYQD